MHFLSLPVSEATPLLQLPCFLTSWRSSLHLQPLGKKPNQYGLLISFEGKKLGLPSQLPLIVWNTSHICLCKTKKPEECGIHWLKGSDKRRIDWFFFFSFSQTMSCGQPNPQCRDTDTPGVVWTKRDPLYRYFSASTVRCSTPTYQLPQCTRIRQKST